jgi:hypothetical protein
MVERWNIGFQKDNSHFNFIVNPAGGGTINPTLHYPLRAVGSMSRRPEPIIPLFHYSTIPIGAKPLTCEFCPLNFSCCIFYE